MAVGGLFRSKPVDRFKAARSGNVATMTALVAPVGLILAAVAVDSASLYYERREAQALTDLAAITAAAHIDKAGEAVAATLKDNGVGRFSLAGPNGSVITSSTGASGPVSVIVTPGRYESAAGTAVASRFSANTQPFNAVKVTLSMTGTRYFAQSLIAPPVIGTTAIAGSSAQASFSIGSRLLKLDGGILNQILGGLTGTQLSLTAMDYESLAKADVSAFGFMDALATDLHLTAATYADVLDSQATVGQIASVLAKTGGIDAAAATAAKAMARDTAAAKTKVDIDRLIDLGSAAGLPIGHSPAGLEAKVSALDILGAAATLSNGAKQVKVDLGANIPGLLSATVDLAIGEPPQQSPWFTIGETGAIVRTAQTRLKLVVQILGPGGLIGASVRLPLYVELAYGEGKLTDINCTGGQRVSVSARPGVAELRIAEVGTLTDFSKAPAADPAKIVQVPLVLSVTGSADVKVTNNAPTTLVFTGTDIQKRVIKTASTRDITQSLTKSLLDTLNLDVQILGLGLGLPGPIKQTVSGLLSTATPAVDTLLDSLLLTLGVRVGQADIRVTGISCGRAVLVQ